MGTIIDTIMLLLFIAFMVFLFGGYHKVKSSQREEQFRKEEELKRAKNE